MRKNPSTEEYLTIADRHIEAAEQRIRQQKRRLFDMATRGEDVSEKTAFIGLLGQALRSMRRYRDQLAGSSPENAEPDAGARAKDGGGTSRRYR